MVTKRVEIFPELQEVHWEDGKTLLDPKSATVTVFIGTNGKSDLIDTALQLLKRRCGKDTSLNVLKLTWENEWTVLVIRRDSERELDAERILILSSSLQGTEAQGYTIDISEGNIYIASQSTVGLLYGTITVTQLIKVEDGKIIIPNVSMRDWPDYKYRGVFEESYTGSSLMRLEDWKKYIDTLALMKFNTLSLGIYNCWSGKLEFMFVPISKHQNIRSEQELTYYSPKSKGKITLCWVPRIYEEDFFGEIIDYASKYGIKVFPHINLLGHNSLIPRLYPELGAKTADGKNKEMGFCLSNPVTYELIYDIYDEIIKKYLKPHKVDWFHIAMDEVYHFCECPDCSKMSKEDQYVSHLIKLVKYLKDAGMTKIVMWNDVVWRSGILDDRFKESLSEAGLNESLTIHWWRYKPYEEICSPFHPIQGVQFISTRPELGIDRWVAPAIGYNCRIPRNADEDRFLQKINSLLQLGYRDKAEGAIAYSIHDPSFHENILALAEFSWNQRSYIGLAEFRHKIHRVISGWRDEDMKVLREYDKIRLDMDFIIRTPLNKALSTLEIPHHLLEPDNLKEARRAILNAKEVVSTYLNGEEFLMFPKNAMENLLVECDWLLSKIGLFNAAISLIYEYNIMVREHNGNKDLKRLKVVKRCLEEFTKEAEFHRAVMSDLERIKEAYNLPDILASETKIMDFVQRFISNFEAVYNQIKTEDVQYPPICYSASPTFFGTGYSGLSRANLIIGSTQNSS